MNSLTAPRTPGPAFDAASALAGAWLRARLELAASSPTGRIYAAALVGLCAAAGRPIPPDPGVEALLARIRISELQETDRATAQLARFVRPGAPDAEAGHSPACELTPDGPALLALGVNGARALVAQIEAASEWGAVDARLPSPCPEVLEGHALAAARASDVVFALRCARARTYCGRPAAGFRRAFATFLDFLQQGDGGYVAHSALAAATRRSEDAVFAVRCAVTVQALWTLAELEQPGFRLMRCALAPRGSEREGL